MSQIESINLNKFELKLADTDDPVALKVSWEPVNPGGASFKTQRLAVFPNRITVEKTGGAILFALVFAIPGVLGVLIGVPLFLLQGNIFAAIFMLIWGAIFGGAGIFMLKGEKPLTFDKSAGVYFRGKHYKQQFSPDRENQGRLSEIYALQLVSERIQSSSRNSHSSTYNSYELNLVFKDGERINVMDHGNAEEIENSAKELAGFLDVPIWQATY